jgi:hypothetical protein
MLVTLLSPASAFAADAAIGVTGTASGDGFGHIIIEDIPLLPPLADCGTLYDVSVPVSNGDTQAEIMQAIRNALDAALPSEFTVTIIKGVVLVSGPICSFFVEECDPGPSCPGDIPGVFIREVTVPVARRTPDLRLAVVLALIAVFALVGTVAARRRREA